MATLVRPQTNFHLCLKQKQHVFVKKRDEIPQNIPKSCEWSHYINITDLNVKTVYDFVWKRTLWIDMNFVFLWWKRYFNHFQILFSLLEDKINIFAPPCNSLYLFWRPIISNVSKISSAHSLPWIKTMRWRRTTQSIRNMQAGWSIKCRKTKKFNRCRVLAWHHNQKRKPNATWGKDY